MPALDQCRPVSKFNLMETEWSQYWLRTALDRMLTQHPLVSKRLTSYVVSLLLASCIFENNCRRFYSVSTLRENISDRVDNELKVTILNMLTHINPGPAQQLVSVRSHIAYVVPV